MSLQALPQALPQLEPPAPYDGLQLCTLLEPNPNFQQLSPEGQNQSLQGWGAWVGPPFPSRLGQAWEDM